MLQGILLYISVLEYIYIYIINPNGLLAEDKISFVNCK